MSTQINTSQEVKITESLTIRDHNGNYICSNCGKRNGTIVARDNQGNTHHIEHDCNFSIRCNSKKALICLCGGYYSHNHDCKKLDNKSDILTIHAIINC